MNILRSILNFFTVPVMLIVRYRRSVAEIKKVKKADHRLGEEFVRNAKIVSTRDEMLKLLPSQGSVAEIGVATGGFSRKILDLNQPKELHLIDYWKEGRQASGATPTGFFSRLFGGGVSAWQTVNEKFEQEIKDGKVHLHRGFSWDELAKMDDASLDWVYIDAGHDFDSVIKDLQVAKDKVKPDGIIAGHDYVRWGKFGFRCGVVEAVNSFCKEHDYELLFLSVESHTNGSFAIRKREVSVDSTEKMES